MSGGFLPQGSELSGDGVRRAIRRVAAFVVVAGAAALSALPSPCVGNDGKETQPNIVFILADDLGYGDLGCYGQKLIRTPCLDRMAAEGIRFTDCYAGSTVCAPSRCSLMTGLHTGHARVRGNALVPLEPGDVTVAEVLKSAGYTTAIIGKWGLGEAGSTGIPTRQGFDYWFGYLNQAHAHNYYPAFLWRNETQVRLQNEVPGTTPERPFGSGVATKRIEYSHDLFVREAAEYLQRHRNDRFFLYLALTIPHANNEAGKRGMEVPDYGPYADKDWPEPEKGRAAMITRMDADIGRLFGQLKQLGLDEKTIVFFSSDNGPHREGGADPEFFRCSGPLRGIKRSMHEGGIRVPMIVRWPGRIKPGTSPLPWAFWDVLPTLAELAGATPPPGLDGISVVPTLLGRPGQKEHEFFYWEFHEGGSQQAVRMGPWKAVRPWQGAIQLYDLRTDLGESRDVAAEHPEIVSKIEAYLAAARTESEHWPMRDAARKTPGKRKTP
jgi:arylsulfatase A-like enzyme